MMYVLCGGIIGFICVYTVTILILDWDKKPDPIGAKMAFYIIALLYGCIGLIIGSILGSLLYIF
jgi:hypothetical protein